MLWMITKDIINAGDAWTAVGKCGDALCASLDATRVPKEQRAGIIAECNYEFRLLDDDGEVYYEGVCKDLDQQSGDDAFEPMDHFVNSDGVTEMQYRKKGEQEWETL